MWSNAFCKRCHLQARRAHVQNALSEHVADFVAARVAAPHALQTSGVRVRF
jgi:4'-phosphopantetheinyl transferase EntD